MSSFNKFSSQNKSKALLESRKKITFMMDKIYYKN